jgi:hypothetical protein
MGMRKSSAMVVFEVLLIAVWVRGASTSEPMTLRRKAREYFHQNPVIYLNQKRVSSTDPRLKELGYSADAFDHQAPRSVEANKEGHVVQWWSDDDCTSCFDPHYRAIVTFDAADHPTQIDILPRMSLIIGDQFPMQKK